jgi:hypothetical protein
MGQYLDRLRMGMNVFDEADTFEVEIVVQVLD